MDWDFKVKVRSAQKKSIQNDQAAPAAFLSAFNFANSSLETTPPVWLFKSFFVLIEDLPSRRRPEILPVESAAKDIATSDVNSWFENSV